MPPIMLAGCREMGTGVCSHTHTRIPDMDKILPITILVGYKFDPSLSPNRGFPRRETCNRYPLTALRTPPPRPNWPAHFPLFLAANQVRPTHWHVAQNALRPLSSPSSYSLTPPRPVKRYPTPSAPDSVDPSVPHDPDRPDPFRHRTPPSPTPRSRHLPPRDSVLLPGPGR